MAKARLLLSLMSRDMVEDIIALIQWRGHAVVNDIFDTQPSAYDPGHPLAILSREYMADEDVPLVLLGLSTVMFGTMRKANMLGMDQYKEILRDAFSLDAAMAESIAKNIETYDVIPWKDSAGNFNWLAIGEKILEGLRKAANWLPERLGIPWEIDQNQKYDRDFLYEMSKLGEAIVSLNRRARLMTSQAQISLSLGMLSTGDPETEGDIDAEIGETFVRVIQRELPPAIYGSLAPLARLGRASTAQKATNILRTAGYGVTPSGQLAQVSPPTNKKVHKIVSQILAMKPSKAALLGAAAGFLPAFLISLLSKKSALSGDITISDSETAREIADLYGDSIADAWLVGDIEEIVKHALNDASQEVSIDDPDAEQKIDKAVAEEIAGDIENMDPEIGGWWSRLKRNWARRRYLRRRRQAMRRAARIMRRMREEEEAMRYKAMADAETPDKYINFTPRFDPRIDYARYHPERFSPYVRHDFRYMTNDEQVDMPIDQDNYFAPSPLDNFDDYFPPETDQGDVNGDES